MKSLILSMLALSLTVVALPARGWEVKSFYPTAVAPSLPDAAQARTAVNTPAPLIGVLQDAHRTAAGRGWVGIASRGSATAADDGVATAPESAEPPR